MDQSAIDLKMMRRCVELSAAAVKQRELPFSCVICRDGEIVAEAINRVVAGRRCHQARRNPGHIGGPADSRPQRPVRLHDLFERRAVPDVLVPDPRDTDRPGRLCHQLADDGRFLQMECAGRQRNLQCHAGGVRRHAGGGGGPALSRGCRGVAKVESGLLARHSLPRLSRRAGRTDASLPDAASPAPNRAALRRRLLASVSQVFVRKRAASRRRPRAGRGRPTI